MNVITINIYIYAGEVSVNFVNDSPLVQGSSITAEFKASGSTTSIVCCLNPKPQSGNKCVQCKPQQQCKTSDYSMVEFTKTCPDFNSISASRADGSLIKDLWFTDLS